SLRGCRRSQTHRVPWWQNSPPPRPPALPSSNSKPDVCSLPVPHCPSLKRALMNAANVAKDRRITPTKPHRSVEHGTLHTKTFRYPSFEQPVYPIYKAKRASPAKLPGREKAFHSNVAR